MGRTLATPGGPSSRVSWPKANASPVVKRTLPTSKAAPPGQMVDVPCGQAVVDLGVVHRAREVGRDRAVHRDLAAEILLEAEAGVQHRVLLLGEPGHQRRGAGFADEGPGLEHLETAHGGEPFGAHGVARGAPLQAPPGGDGPGAPVLAGEILLEAVEEQLFAPFGAGSPLEERLKPALPEPNRATLAVVTVRPALQAGRSIA